MPTTRRRTPRLPTPETLRQQVVLEEHDLAPDGSFAIVTRRSVEGEEYVSHLWLVPLDVDGAEPRRLTTGTVRDMEPRIAPDGTRVAFTRCTPDVDRKDIRILDLRGGESGAPGARGAVGRGHRVVARWPADRLPRADWTRSASSWARCPSPVTRTPRNRAPAG